MGRLCAVASSYWTTLALGAAALALHVCWYAVGKAAGGEVVSGFGAALVVLGLWVAVLELVRIGPTEMARRQVELDLVWFGEQVPALRERRKQTAIAAKRAIIVERVVAGAIAAVGTVLNGFGPLIASVLHLHS